MKSQNLNTSDVVDGRYTILGRLGAGGFATVYDAHHMTLDRPVALKVLDVTGITDPNYTERFAREARICAQIDHPAVIRIFDFGQLPEGAPYIAMEKLVGHDLEVELKTHGPLPLQRMLRLFVPVLEGLGKAHSAGVVHKDLKPSNLFLVHPNTHMERLVILDFGIARVMDAKTQLTQVGSFAGTPAYLAPEYIQSQIVTPALDVYQMALIITESLSGRAVVRADSAVGYIMKHIQGAHDVPDEIRRTALGETLLRALSTDPTKRFTNATGFAKALSDLATGSFPLPQAPPPATISPASSPATLELGNSHVMQPAKKNPPVFVIALITVGVMVVGGCFFCTLLMMI